MAKDIIRYESAHELQLEETDAQPLLNIPVLRKATFKAGRYGKLEFNDTLLAALVENFNNKRAGVDISIDARHQPELGALGWIKELKYDGAQLIAVAEATPRGAELVRNRTYKYASAEIDMQFTDRETGETHGPVMMGVALTNRPYVHRQGPVTFLSEDVGFDHIVYPDLRMLTVRRIGGTTMTTRNDGRFMTVVGVYEEK